VSGSRCITSPASSGWTRTPTGSWAPPIGAGFPTEPLASAGGHLWAIPSTGGSLADPQLRTLLEIDAPSGRIMGSYRTRGRPQDFVAAGDSVWVATTEPNELVRFSSSGTRGADRRRFGS
jgi:hypothetical protein